jgi:hypothetical protein
MPLRINSAFVGMSVTSNGSLDAWNGGYVPLLKLDMCYGSGICGALFFCSNSLLQVGGGRPLVSVTTSAPQWHLVFRRS